MSTRSSIFYVDRNYEDIHVFHDCKDDKFYLEYESGNRSPIQCVRLEISKELARKMMEFKAGAVKEWPEEWG